MNVAVCEKVCVSGEKVVIVFDTDPHISASIDSSDSRHNNNRARTHTHTLGPLSISSIITVQRGKGGNKGS